jgi:hypothetical protein
MPYGILGTPPVVAPTGALPSFGNVISGGSSTAALNENAFKAWYAKHAQKQGLNPNPDDPQHYYDYRAAFAAGAEPDAYGHWPSQFKQEGHPRMIIEGVNTKTGQPIAPQPAGILAR